MFSITTLTQSSANITVFVVSWHLLVAHRGKRAAVGIIPPIHIFRWSTDRPTFTHPQKVATGTFDYIWQKQQQQ
jgi:hypothetical protein